MKMTRRTVRGHVRLEEIFNNNKNGGLKRTCLMIRRKTKTGGIKHTCQVVKLESKSRMSIGTRLLIRRKPQRTLFNLLLRCQCSSCILPFTLENIRNRPSVNDDQRRQWLQVQPSLDSNRITNGINGIAGKPMIGINGHLGLHVAMMMGGRRGHSGIVNRRSTSTQARLCRSLHAAQFCLGSWSCARPDGHGRLWPNRLWPNLVFECFGQIFSTPKKPKLLNPEDLNPTP